MVLFLDFKSADSLRPIEQGPTFLFEPLKRPMKSDCLCFVLLFQDLRVVLFLNQGQFLPYFSQETVIGYQEPILALLDDSRYDGLEVVNHLGHFGLQSRAATSGQRHLGARARLVCR